MLQTFFLILGLEKLRIFRVGFGRFRVAGRSLALVQYLNPGWNSESQPNVVSSGIERYHQKVCWQQQCFAHVS
jgi:hypothetical protein